MIKVHTQICTRFATDISLVEMFRHPTISTLTDYFSNTDTPKHQPEVFRSEKLADGKQRLHQRLQQKKGSINEN